MPMLKSDLDAIKKLVSDYVGKRGVLVEDTSCLVTIKGNSVTVEDGESVADEYYNSGYESAQEDASDDISAACMENLDDVVQNVGKLKCDVQASSDYKKGYTDALEDVGTVIENTEV